MNTLESNRKIKIVMLSSGLSLTGNHRMMMDVLENIDQQSFDVSVCYKSDYPNIGKELLPILKGKGVRLVPIRGRRLFDIKGLFDLFKILLKDKVDILHCWDSLGFAGRVLGKLSRTRIVDSVANPPVHSSWKNEMLNSATSIFLDGIIFCSHDVKTEYQKKKKYRIRHSFSKVIYNTVNLKEIDRNQLNIKERVKYGLNTDDIVLINLAYFNEQKVQEYIIEALAEVVKIKPNVKLLLVGWGHREPILRDTAGSLGINDHVIFTGKKYHDEALKLLSISDIYVSSSLWEGFGIAVAEAMAFAKPVVATDIMGHKEVVANGVTGLLVPPINFNEMASAIIKLIDNPTLAMRMGKEGRSRVKKLFNVEKFIAAHEAFYKNILLA